MKPLFLSLISLSGMLHGHDTDYVLIDSIHNQTTCEWVCDMQQIVPDLEDALIVDHNNMLWLDMAFMEASPPLIACLQPSSNLQTTQLEAANQMWRCRTRFCWRMNPTWIRYCRYCGTPRHY